VSNIIVKEKNGVKMYLDRYLDGTHVWTVKGKGVETLKFIGYQNAYHAENYFNKCVKKRG
jgi:hypothetical protein